MGLERQEAKHHMKHAEQTEKCMPADQNGTSPEHSIQAPIHDISHTAKTLAQPVPSKCFNDNRKLHLFVYMYMGT